jgi:ABC-type dipeptide/oligopeptide/nickel transport system permease subunit
VGVLVAWLAMLIGVSAKLVDGYARGWLCELIMRATDVLLSVPEPIPAPGRRSCSRPASRARCRCSR